MTAPPPVIDRIAALWAWGVPGKTIAFALGLSPLAVRLRVARARARGDTRFARRRS